MWVFCVNHKVVTRHIQIQTPPKSCSMFKSSSASKPLSSLNILSSTRTAVFTVSTWRLSSTHARNLPRQKVAQFVVTSVQAPRPSLKNCLRRSTRTWQTWRNISHSTGRIVWSKNIFNLLFNHFLLPFHSCTPCWLACTVLNIVPDLNISIGMSTVYENSWFWRSPSRRPRSCRARNSRGIWLCIAQNGRALSSLVRGPSRSDASGNTCRNSSDQPRACIWTRPLFHQWKNTTKYTFSFNCRTLRSWR